MDRVQALAQRASARFMLGEAQRLERAAQAVRRQAEQVLADLKPRSIPAGKASTTAAGTS